MVDVWIILLRIVFWLLFIKSLLAWKIVFVFSLQLLHSGLRTQLVYLVYFSNLLNQTAE